VQCLTLRRSPKSIRRSIPQQTVLLFHFWNTPCRARPDSYDRAQIRELLLNDSFMMLGLVTVIASGPIALYRSSRGSSLIFLQLQWSGRDFTRIFNILGVSLVVAHGSYL
jgi:hypothetical protein